MSDTNHPKPDSDDWLNKDQKPPFKTNRRKSTRYIRNDIGVTIRKSGMFDFNFLSNLDSSVKLIDISSRGVQIATNIHFPLNQKISLTIRFFDFKEFQIPSKVMRKKMGDLQIYGIKFDQVNNDLANYLLKTQRKLKFK